MRLVPIKISEYEKDKGVTSDGLTAVQFVYTPESNFGNLLKSDKQVGGSEIKQEDVLSKLLNDEDLLQKLSETSKVIGDTVKKENSATEGNELLVGASYQRVDNKKNYLELFESNVSVVGLGVSLQQSIDHFDSLQKSKAQVYVHIDLSSQDLESCKDRVKETYSNVNNFVYVYNVDLQYMDSNKFSEFLTADYPRAVVIGEYLVDLESNGQIGVFSPSVIRGFRLEYDYTDLSYYATKIKLGIGEIKKVPLTELTYNFTIKNNSKEKAKSVKTAKEKTEKTEKPKKEKAPKVRKVAKSTLFGSFGSAEVVSSDELLVSPVAEVVEVVEVVKKPIATKKKATTKGSLFGGW